MHTRKLCVMNQLRPPPFFWGGAIYEMQFEIWRYVSQCTLPFPDIRTQFSKMKHAGEQINFLKLQNISVPLFKLIQTLLRHEQLTPRSRTLLQTLSVPRLVQKFPHLWKPKIHYHVHKSPPVAPTLRQVNPAHNLSSTPRSSLSFRFLRQNSACISSPRIASTCPAHLIFQGLSTQIIFGENYGS